ncbi:hypothetical protein FN846DRAFT_915458 [Sphaerosporella brunnea]|uniref:Uncharacterized protein n=1 Tax=Sphaerosporella brunnea TaxID=1250544 RepID=A0A5J5FBU3_9PEZI|nr:hypothetical protein FN846DRAFT_915458 [Sphaerosporella brunnea]
MKAKTEPDKTAGFTATMKAKTEPDKTAGFTATMKAKTEPDKTASPDLARPTMSNPSQSTLAPTASRFNNPGGGNGSRARALEKLYAEARRIDEARIEKAKEIPQMMEQGRLSFEELQRKHQEETRKRMLEVLQRKRQEETRKLDEARIEKAKEMPQMMEQERLIFEELQRKHQEETQKRLLEEEQKRRKKRVLAQRARREEAMLRKLVEGLKIHQRLQEQQATIVNGNGQPVDVEGVAPAAAEATSKQCLESQDKHLPTTPEKEKTTSQGKKMPDAAQSKIVTNGFDDWAWRFGLPVRVILTADGTCKIDPEDVAAALAR